MNLSTRFTLILILILATTDGLYAQEAASTATAGSTTDRARVAGTSTAEAAPSETEGSSARPAGAEVERLDSAAIRDRFSNVIRAYPPEVATIISLDPSLLSEAAFLARYPAIAEFVAAHPEVRSHPRYYLAQFDDETRRPRPSAAAQMFDAVATAFGITVMVLSVMWLIRTLIEQRRWSRLSRTQSEVHNKILDRFSTSEELLTYIRTPAGTKFLESAPIPLHAERATPNTPVARSIWSIQIGVIVAAAAVGMLLVSFALDKDGAEGMFAMGVIAFSIGIGFIASAAVSLLLSRRLGLWHASEGGEGMAANRVVDDAGFVK